jgi:hypothetical protein
MSSTLPRRPEPGSPRPSPLKQDPRRFAGRVKVVSLGLSVVGFGLAWTLVSQHVVGATNVAPAQAAPAQAAPAVAAPAPTSAPTRVPVPSNDFFGQPGAQPQPMIGNGGGGQPQAPIVRGRTS